LSFSFDHAFKSFAEDEDLGLLRVMAKFQVPEDAKIEHLDRELVPPSLRVDHLYRITTEEGSTAVHMEAFTTYDSEWQRRHARYAALIWAKYEIKLAVFMFLLTDRGVPKELSGEFQVDGGDLELRMRVRIVKLWEVPAEELIATGDPATMAWVPLANFSGAQLWKAANLIRASGDSEVRSRMTLLYGLRYRNIEVLESMLTEEMMRESAYYQKILNRGVEQGRLDGGRGLVRKLLITKFGPLSERVEGLLQNASNAEIDVWGIRLLEATSLDDVLR
jgi:predicted transposase YdaD